MDTKYAAVFILAVLVGAVGGYFVGSIPLQQQMHQLQLQLDELDQYISELDVLLSEKEQRLESLQRELETRPPLVTIHDGEVRGLISDDQIWSGTINVTDHVMVPKNVSVTITPGTVVRFTHYRGYKDPGKRLGISIMGCLKAVGTPDQMIWFTSDAEDPQNGDWGMIHFRDADPASILMYAVIEFGQQGVNLWRTNMTISHSVVRWHNWEGIYLESYCRPLISYNRIYQNGYNGIAMEQYNQALLIGNTIAQSGTNGVHVDASKAILVHNQITDNQAFGLSVDDHAEAIAVRNTIQGNGEGYGFGDGANNLTAVGNLVIENTVDIPPPPPGVLFENVPGEGAGDLVYDYPDPKPYDLGYTPGDPEKDGYPYIYPDEDETRRVVQKIGEGLGLTWSVAWDGAHIWTAVPWGIIYELDPTTGAILTQLPFPGPQAWGMTYDGAHLWVNDFAEKKVYEMDTDGNVLSAFLIPDPVGGAKGITWDGEYLYIMGWTTPTIYQVDKQGTLKGTIVVEEGAGGGLTWDGECFWAPGGRGIAKINAQGQIVGSIYAASEGTWDLAWDGTYLWATQRTNENWMDAKLYQIEVLNTT